jgi:hypothetical protein
VFCCGVFSDISQYKKLKKNVNTFYHYIIVYCITVYCDYTQFISRHRGGERCLSLMQFVSVDDIEGIDCNYV